ncbi:MAG: RNA 2',3'-cyclic phosphodiesterase [Anaerolineae bacterium]|nr:RNA 2',3'-cyclic phosphodiesterase [Anaerolineae bacterium]
MLRTFIAIELDDELCTNLGRIQDRLRNQTSPGSVRWVRPEGIHLTLKFLGDTTEAQAEQVQEALARAAATVEPFSFSVGTLGCFPNARQPRVVWVGIHESTGALARLQRAVEAEVSPLGFPTERRTFSPHLTLGRIGQRATKSEVREVGEVVVANDVGIVDTMDVAHVAYIKSDLRPTGAVYTTLSEAALGR